MSCDKSLNWFVFASPPMQGFASRFCSRFNYPNVLPIQRSMFSDGCPNLKISHVPEMMRVKSGASVLFFHAYRSMQEKKVEEMLLFVLAETCNVERLVVVDPFDPWATMERIQNEGEVASANIDAHFWKTLPTTPSGRKVLRLIYDQHTLTNRFYYQGGNTQVAYRSALPLFIDHIGKKGWFTNVKDYAIAFPDEGAQKRFGRVFPSGTELVTCGKKRGDGDERFVTLLEGHAEGRHVCIVDDLVRSGGTLLECARALLAHGAKKVSCFVVHAEFPQDAWKKFIPHTQMLEKSQEGKVVVELDTFYITDSCADVADKLRGVEPFEVISIADDVADFLAVIGK